jgi:FkbM family methyltransferase
MSDAVVRVETPDGPVWLRPGTTDQNIFDQVLGPEGMIPVGDGAARFIIDAGAHIGLASVLFASRFPSARIVAIEPQADNFAMLERNTARFPGICPIRAGLWWHGATLKIQNPGEKSWGFRLAEGDGGDVAAVTVGNLMQRFAFDRIDILKLDVEGAEKEVLEHAAGWIDRVDTMIVELHDRVRVGCTEALEQAIAGRGFERTLVGVNSILKRL